MGGSCAVLLSPPRDLLGWEGPSTFCAQDCGYVVMAHLFSLHPMLHLGPCPGSGSFGRGLLVWRAWIRPCWGWAGAEGSPRHACHGQKGPGFHGGLTCDSLWQWAGPRPAGCPCLHISHPGRVICLWPRIHWHLTVIPTLSSVHSASAGGVEEPLSPFTDKKQGHPQSLAERAGVGLDPSSGWVSPSTGAPCPCSESKCFKKVLKESSLPDLCWPPPSSLLPCPISRPLTTHRLAVLPSPALGPLPVESLGAPRHAALSGH